MIDMLKRFFGSTPGGGQETARDKEHRLLVATCALLVELARIDESFTEQEVDTIIEILETRHGLSKAHAEALIAEADKELVESVDLWQFARLINENYPREEKLRIIETLWQVVFVDGQMDMHEDYLMHKVSKLLRLHHQELMEAKLKILYGKPSQ
jgi:uncharacterized tellurite resistance protein B-like protein